MEVTYPDKACNLVRCTVGQDSSCSGYDSFNCSSCSTGGVVASSVSGLIVCSNTLDERLRIAYAQTLPEVRTALFGAVQRA